MAKCLFCCDDFCCCGGSSSGGSSGNGSGDTLKPATYTTLGGIIVGDGLKVERDGTLSVDFSDITKQDIIDSVFGGFSFGGGGSVAMPDVFKGATLIKGGASGLVPAPQAGDQNKFLCGNGEWVTVGSGSGTIETDYISKEDFIDYVFGGG